MAELEATLVEQQAEEAAKILPGWRVMAADHEDLQTDIKALLDKWASGQCLTKICASLKLDPATFYLPAAGKAAEGLMVCTSLISNDVGHFVKLYVTLYEQPVIKQSAELAVDDFGMLLYLIGREFAECKQVLKTEMILYLLFCGLDGTGADSAYWRETLEVAPIMNHITEANRQYLIRLKKGDI